MGLLILECVASIVLIVYLGIARHVLILTSCPLNYIKMRTMTNLFHAYCNTCTCIIYKTTMLGILLVILYLNMSMQHWTKLNIGGDKPPVRRWHATCCIAGPLMGQQHPLLMVVGGEGRNYYGDVWLLDVDKGVWSEVGMLYLIV